jgi:hypothetical protein
MGRKGRTEEIGNVEARRAGVTERFKVLLASIVVSRVDNPTSSEKDETVEEGDDVGSGLVDGEDNGTLVIASKSNEGFDDVEGVEGVET